MVKCAGVSLALQYIISPFAPAAPFKLALLLTFPNPTFVAVGVVQVPAYVSHFVVLEVFNAGPFNTLLLSELSANNK